MSTVTVNGKVMQTTHQTLELLINELALSQGRFAVEVDGELVPKSQLNQFAIQDGMIIEVVQAVGGG
ncbi:MAG: sulfur carrier protein ThiS [Psychrobacter sp.]|nr:sulfur carrier protein ThiS [Psychrobacter sp.]